MSNEQYSYVLDTTAALPANRVTEEAHTVTPVNNRDYNFIIPKFAPYFPSTVRLVRVVGNVRTLLTEGVDWVPALHFQGASASVGRPVYGAVSFVNKNYTGNVVFERYQTLGGQYTLDDQEMTEVIANIIFNPRGATWEEMTNLPTMFAPTDHPWNYTDMVGQSQVVAAIDALTATIHNKSSASLNAHIQNRQNPHGVTKHQIDLSNVENFGPSSANQAILGASNTTLITPMTLRAVLDNMGLLNLSALIRAMDEHVQDKSNPHGTTKHHVDLGQVENLPVATPSDIVSRRRERKYVTLDMMMDYIAMYGCNAREQEAPDHPPKGALLSIYCNNVNRIGVYATGAGNTYEEIIEVNSRSCGYVPPPSSPSHPAQGTLLAKHCVDKDQHGTYADGYGGSFTRLIMVNSTECGYTGTVPPPGGNHPPAGTILSQRCEGTTLIKVTANGTGGSFDDRVPNSPSCEVQASHPPAGTLVDVSCDGYTQMGRYTNGSGGYYNAVVQLNSVDCGYIAPTTPPITTAPPTTTPPPAAVTVTLTSSKATVAENSTFQLTLSVTGLAANAPVSAGITGTQPSGATYTAMNTQNGTANAQGVYTVNHTVNHIPSQTGNHSYIGLVTVNGQQRQSGTVSVNMLASSVVTQPTINATVNKTTLAVGQTATLSLAMSNLTPGREYLLNIFKQNPGETGWASFGSSTVRFTPTGSTHNWSGDFFNYGDVVSGTGRFMADLGGLGTSVRSNETSISYTSNKSIRLTLGGSSAAEMSQKSGASLALRADFSDFPITGKSGTVSMTVSSLTGDGNAVTGAQGFKFTTNSSGAGTHTQQVTLNRIGTNAYTIYRIETTWVPAGGGNPRKLWSNEIRVVWQAATVNLQASLASPTSVVYLNEYVTGTVTMTGGEPNTQYKATLTRRFQDWQDYYPSGEDVNITMTTNASGGATGTVRWQYTRPEVNTPGNTMMRYTVQKANGSGPEVTTNVAQFTAYGTTRPGTGQVGLPTTSSITVESGNASNTVYLNQDLTVWWYGRGLTPNSTVEYGLEWKFATEAANQFREYVNSQFGIPTQRATNAAGNSGAAAERFLLRFGVQDAALADAGPLNIRGFMRIPGSTAKIYSSAWITFTLVGRTQ